MGRELKTDQIRIVLSLPPRFINAFDTCVIIRSSAPDDGLNRNWSASKVIVFSLSPRRKRRMLSIGRWGALSYGNTFVGPDVWPGGSINETNVFQHYGSAKMAEAKPWRVLTKLTFSNTRYTEWDANKTELYASISFPPRNVRLIDGARLDTNNTHAGPDGGPAVLYACQIRFYTHNYDKFLTIRLQI